MVLRLFRVLYWVGFIAPIVMVVMFILRAILGTDLGEPIVLFLLSLCGHAILFVVHYIIRGQLVALPWRLK